MLRSYHQRNLCPLPERTKGENHSQQHLGPDSRCRRRLRGLTWPRTGLCARATRRLVGQGRGLQEGWGEGRRTGTRRARVCTRVCVCACMYTCVCVRTACLSDLTEHGPLPPPPSPAAASAASAREHQVWVARTPPPTSLGRVPGQVAEEGRGTHAAPVQDRAPAGPPSPSAPCRPRSPLVLPPLPSARGPRRLSEQAPLHVLPCPHPKPWSLRLCDQRGKRDFTAGMTLRDLRWSF